MTRTTPDTAMTDGPSPEETTGALIPLETIDLPAMFTTGTGTDAFLAEMRRRTAAIVPDTSTDKGRKEIKSLAYRVARTKTMVDEAGKAFTDERRKELKAIDANRATLRDALDALRDEVRKPVDDWEAAEEARQLAELAQARAEAAAREAAEVFEREVQARIDTWAGMPAQFVGLDLATAERRLADMLGSALTPALFGERLAEAEQVRTDALAKIDGLLALQRKMAALEAEAAAARQREAEREAAERARQAREQAEREQTERAERERAHALQLAIDGLQTRYLLAASGATAERITTLLAQLRAEPIDAATYGARVGDAQASVVVALRKLQELRAAAVAAEQAERERQAAQAELERAQAENARLRQEQEAREAAERQRQEAEAAAAAKREAEARKASHRKRIRTEATKALTGVIEISAREAQLLVEAIEAGTIPHVTLAF